MNRFNVPTYFVFSAAVDSVLSITYGITPTSFEHPFIQVTEAVNKIFADVAKGGYLGQSSMASIDEARC